MKKAYLVLEDGRVFEGTRFGADRETVGELVFATGMCGYLETLTDPSYYGQIVLQTFPMIGNYGVIPGDFEGKNALFGYVVREWCEEPSNFRSEGNLDTYLRSVNIPGLFGVDTREITGILREHGVMNAGIFDEVPTDLSILKRYTVKDAVASVTCRQRRVVPAEGERRFAVTLIDYGAKENIVRSLTSRGCEVTVVPADTKAETILADAPDGVMLSNGPGDPAENTAAIAELKKLFGKLPIFGICLGHQLLALATGAGTVKLKYGHRSVNQPARDLVSGRTVITSQNHGYAVDPSTLKCGSVRFVNANDGTCEGIDYPENAFTVQFHPEACSGPHDSAFLFDRFLAMMEKSSGKEKTYAAQFKH